MRPAFKRCSPSCTTIRSPDVESTVGGALLVDKPAGLSSHEVVARVRKLFGTRAVGHTGTLDPFATGLLVLVLGSSTRLARWAERRSKTYRAVARLGQVTTTDDLTGEILEDGGETAWPGRGTVEKALSEFLGTHAQRPPAYSAKRVDGVRSYRAARRSGIALDLKPVPVTVFAIELLEWKPPFVTFRAEVSPGTYLRALARDLGASLRTGAHLTELRRERIGPWRVEQAHRLADLTGDESLLPAEALVQGLGRIDLSPEEARLVRHGRDIARDSSVEGPEAGLYEGDRLVAIGNRTEAGWHPVLVLPDVTQAVP